MNSKQWKIESRDIHVRERRDWFAEITPMDCWCGRHCDLRGEVGPEGPFFKLEIHHCDGDWTIERRGLGVSLENVLMEAENMLDALETMEYWLH